MKVELVVATGDPANPGAAGVNWALTPTVFMVRFVYDGRWSIGWFFQMMAMLTLDHDDILVISVDDDLNAAQIARVAEIRDFVIPGRKVCLLDNGVLLANLTNNQIVARVG